MTEKKPIIHVFSNGLRLVYLHTESPVSHFGLTLLSGSRYERSHEMGLAHFLEHCLFKGTKKRKAFHILSRLDSVGGELNAYTAKEELCIYASYSKEYTDRAIELIADISINSSFPNKEIEKEKEIILDEINSYLDNPSDKIFDDFEELLFKNHELGNNILGNKKSVQSFDKEHLCNYVNRLFTTSNGVISFVGDLPLKKVVKICEKYFSNFPSHKNEIEINTFKNYKPFKVTRKEANYQNHLVIGGIAPGYTNKEKVCISLLINLLGGPALNSRLVLS
ncbi:MAG: peptidase M16, partial [Crocinitomicaceae bacterium]|nr:peptidase M16 [Crocinitomicaceae bacterium]